MQAVAAFTLIELLFAMGVAATVAAVAVPQLVASVDDIRTAAAARLIASTLQQTRMEAVMRGRATAVRFTRTAGGYEFAVFGDGNRNGVRTPDITAGHDPQLRAPRRLNEMFPGVDFGAAPGLPAVEASALPPGDDPIRLGSSDMVTFTPLGTATAGSLYVRGKHDVQYVVRIFGETGRTRLLKFTRWSRTWKPL
jgi:type II secretory pathway pseudopilin PulG